MSVGQLEEVRVSADEPEAEPSTDAVEVDRPWRRALLSGFAVWIATKVGLLAVAAFSWFTDESSDISLSEVIHTWSTQWDSNWFIDIAARGYLESENGHAAFFPLFPALIRLCTPLFLGRGWLAALTLANLALLAALVLLFHLTEQEFGKAAAGRTIFYLVAFPTGFFLSAPYNSGLFIALMVGVLYSLRRCDWWAAGILGALATSTRSAGLLLVLPFAFEYLRTQRWRIRPDAIAIGLIPLGLGAVMLVNKIYLGDPMAFSEAQSTRFGREFAWPWEAVIDSVRMVAGDDPVAQPFGWVWAHNVLELGTVLTALVLVGLSVAGPWRMRRDQLVFPLFAMALIVFMVMFPSSWIPWPLVSTSRLGLEIIPVFMMLGVLGRYALVDRVALALFLPVQSILVVTFLHGAWVA